MCSLRQRMDACIGTTRAVHCEPLAAEALDRSLDDFLHRQAVILALPADETGAVIFEDQLVAGHGSRVPTGSGKPRRKAAPSVAPRPGRWRPTRRSAPAPEAIVGIASSTVPGAPRPSSSAAVMSLMRSPFASNQQSSARTWRSSSIADLRQSI